MRKVRNGRVAARTRSKICKLPVARYSRRMTDELATVVLSAIERAPQWIRRDLDSKDRIVRVQAEESLAAIIADALRKTGKLLT